MYNRTNKIFQLFNLKLASFFILILIFVFSFPVSAFEAINYYKEYSGSRMVPIYQVERADNKITLTVDGAWGSSKTEALLELFAAEDIPVSFFFAGIWLENHPELVKKITDAGHQIYNHSYSHPHFNYLTEAEIKEELLKTEAIIDNYQQSELKTKLFRPPYGEYNQQLIKIARKLDYQIVQWSLDSHDWMDPGENYIKDRIKNNINAGDILLFHNNSNNIVEILSEIIPMLKQEYEFVKIEDLIYNNNYEINSLTGVQTKIKDDDNGN